MNSELMKLVKEKKIAVSHKKWKEAADHCNYIGSELCRLGKTEKALEFHKEELSYNDLIGDRLGAAVANRRIGECYSQMNDFEKALSHIKLFKKIATEVGNVVEQQRAWATLGTTFYIKYECEQESSDLSKAEASYRQALELAKKLEPSKNLKCELSEKEVAEMKTRCFLNLGLVYECQKDILKCGECIRKAIYLASKFNLQEDLNRCQNSLASVYQKHERYADSLRVLEEAIASAGKIGDKTLHCDELYTKATILLALKDFEGAKHSLKKAYKLHSPLEEDHKQVIKALKICVGLCMSQNKLQEIDISDSEERKLLLERIADGLSSLECYKLALEFYFLTLQCMEEGTFTNKEKAPIYFSIAMTYKDMGERDKALEYLNKELKCNEEEPKEQIKTMWNIVEILEEVQNVSLSEIVLRKAVTLSKNIGSHKLQYRALTKQFHFYKQNNMMTNANEINEMIKNSTLEDLSSDESDVEEESRDPFEDIHLSDLSDSEDVVANTETKAALRPKRQPKKPELKRNVKGETPLHKACIDGNFNEVKKLIECGHSLKVVDFSGWNPLHEASNYGHFDIVEYLLDKGASINDRGSSGITALHDAACNGNLDVVQLLISRGASVTVLDDDGNTPLRTLLMWKNRADLDADTLRLCEKIEEELKAKMLQAGKPARDVEVDDIPDNFFDEDDDIPDNFFDEDNEPLCRSSPERVVEKRSRPASFSSEEEGSEDTGDLESCTSQLSTKSDGPSDWDTANGAKSEYQAVMSNLRRSAKSVSSEHRIVPKTVEKKSGLVDEEEVIDDWLVWDTKQDVKTQRKRRKVAPMNVRTSSSLYNYLEPKNNSEFLDSEEKKNCVIEDNSNDDPQPVSSSNHRKDFETRDNPFVNPSISNSGFTSKLPFWLKVWVCDKCIHVPVPEVSLSIEWLKEEISNRYQSEYLSRPHLTSLRKIDGAILLNADIIKSSLVHNEELKSIVVKWDEPTLEERYVHICKIQKIKPLLDIQEQLVNFNTKCEIDFSNRPLDIQHINFIFESISHFRNVLHLSFKGTMIISTNIPSIISCIPSFVSLVTLNLSTCSLFTDTLQQIAEYLDHQSSPENRFPRLQTLSLNYNAFFAPCSPYINSILQIPSLTILGIRNCDLHPMTFEDLNLCQTLKHCSNLEEFNIAANILTDKSMQNFLQHLPKSNLVKLNLAFTAEECPDFATYLMNSLTSEFPQLAELSLDECNLTDQDLLLFTPAEFSSLPKLKSIDLSGNYKLSASAVIHFLKVASIGKRPLDIHLTGACEWDIQDIFELIKEIDFASLSSLTLNNISEVGQEELFDWWKRCWKDKAQCIDSLFCKLSLL